MELKISDFELELVYMNRLPKEIFNSVLLQRKLSSYISCPWRNVIAKTNQTATFLHLINEISYLAVIHPNITIAKTSSDKTKMLVERF